MQPFSASQSPRVHEVARNFKALTVRAGAFASAIIESSITFLIPNGK